MTSSPEHMARKIEEIAARHAADVAITQMYGGSSPTQTHWRQLLEDRAFLLSALKSSPPMPGVIRPSYHDFYKTMWKVLYDLKIQDDAPVAPRLAIAPTDLPCVLHHAAKAITALLTSKPETQDGWKPTLPTRAEILETLVMARAELRKQQDVAPNDVEQFQATRMWRYLTAHIAAAWEAGKRAAPPASKTQDT